MEWAGHGAHGGVGRRGKERDMAGEQASRGRGRAGAIRRAGEPAPIRGNSIGSIEAHAFAAGAVAACNCKGRSRNVPDRGLAESRAECAVDAVLGECGSDRRRGSERPSAECLGFGRFEEELVGSRDGMLGCEGAAMRAGEEQSGRGAVKAYALGRRRRPPPAGFRVSSWSPPFPLSAMPAVMEGY